MLNNVTDVLRTSETYFQMKTDSKPKKYITGI